MASTELLLLHRGMRCLWYNVTSVVHCTIGVRPGLNTATLPNNVPYDVPVFLWYKLWHDVPYNNKICRDCVNSNQGRLYAIRIQNLWLRLLKISSWPKNRNPPVLFRVSAQGNKKVTSRSNIMNNMATK